MKNFAKFVIEHPKITAAILIAITAFWIYGVPRLKVDPDMLNYLPKKMPEVVFFKQVGEKFGSNYISLIGIESDDIFTYETLSTIRKLTEAFESLPEVYQVTSIANIIDIKKIEGGIEIAKLLPSGEITKDTAELKKLRDYALSEEMYKDRLVSSDGRVSLIMVRIRENAQKVEVAAKIKELSQKIAPDYKLYFSGFPQVMEYAGRLIPKDMKRLLPIVVLVTIVTLFLSFGTIRGVSLPLFVVLVALLWTLGFMGLVKIPLTIVSSAMPVLLIAVGTAYGIHVLSRYYEWVEPTRYKETFLKALASVGIPVFMAGFTTVIGFLSNLTASLTLIKQLGLCLAFGVTTSLLISLTGVPDILVFIGYKPMPKSFNKKSKSGFLERFLDKVALVVFNRTKPVIAVFAVITVIAIIFVPRITREVNIIEYFPKDSEPRLAQDLMERHFGGSQFFSIDVKANDVKHPAVLQNIYQLSKKLRAVEHVKNPQSIADLVAEMNDKMNDTKSVPARLGEVSNLWLFIEGEKILEQMVDGTYQETILQASLDVINTTINRNKVTEIEKILSSTPTELASVEIKSLKGEQREKVVSLHAKKIAEMIRSDLEFYGKTPPETDKLERAIKNSMLNPVKLKLKEIIKLKSRLVKLTSSVDFELPLPVDKSELLADKLLQDAKERVEQIGLDYINSTLTSVLDEAKIAYEPDQTSLASEFILAKIELFIKEKRAKDLVKRMDRESRVKIDDPNLKRDILGDFWGTNDEFVYVSVDDYKKIFGKSPDEQNVTAFEISFTGMPPLMRKFDDELLKSQMQSLLIAMVTVFILMALLLRSLVGGLLAIVPVSFTTLFNFGLMGATGLPLDNSAAMIASVAIGVGIDYSIHFVSRFRFELSENKSTLEALEITLARTGRAILVNTLAVAVGFIVLIFSELDPLRRFGVLLSVTMFISATAALTLFPALMISLKPKFLQKKQSQKEVQT